MQRRPAGPAPVLAVVAVLLVAFVVLVRADGSEPRTAPAAATQASPGPLDPPTRPSPSAVATAPAGGAADGAVAALPRGGTRLFPHYRLVGYAGGPGSAAFGRLGVGKLEDRLRELDRTARAYTADGRTVLPVLELITVVAHGKPGRDGQYRGRIDSAVIDAYLAAARRHRALLLLNVQPGRADVLDEVKGLERWLREPDVGLALDPEWAVGPRQVPGQVFGRTSARVLNDVVAYVDGLVERDRLPEKAVVVHQLAPRIIDHVRDVRSAHGARVILSVDGIGTRAEKTGTWTRLVRPLHDSVAPGFKLFFEEDRGLMSATQVLRLRPRPEYVLYE